MEGPIRGPAKTLGLWLTLAVLGLAAVHGLVNYCWYTSACGTGNDIANRVGYLFNLNAELNVPTWFSTVLLFSAAAGFAVILRAQPAGARGRGYWIGLIVLCLYLSLDEATDLHGLWPQPETDDEAWQAGFGWVYAGGALVLTIGAVYLRWVLSLPPAVRASFLLAGSVYVAGGLGLEVLGGRVADETFFNLPYILVSTAEEVLEMLGVVILLVGIVLMIGTLRARAD